MYAIAGLSRVFRRVAAVLALLCASLILIPSEAGAQDYRFTSFAVEGNERVDPSTVLAFLGIEPGQSVSASELNDAFQRLQGSGLFESVELEPRGATLVAVVREYPTINRINIEGNRRIEDADLMTVVQSQPRRVYSPSLAEQDAAAITQAYELQGRLTATVTPAIIRRSENRVDLVFEVAEGRVVETERIAFVGNRAYSDRRLRRVVESTQAGIFRQLIGSDTFIADRIAFDRQLLSDFYRDRGYVDFTVQSVTSELARERNAFFITFNLIEGQSFSFGEITTVSEIADLDAQQFQDTVRIRPGVTFSPRLVDTTITRMENLASQMGLRFIRIEPRVTRNDEDLTLDIEFVISRGQRVFVERIDIEGNATTLDRVIRRQFRSAEGDPLDPRDIRQSAERIRALGYFSDVAVDARPGSSEEQVIVDVNVEEQPTGSLGFGANYSTDTGVGLAITFSEENFLGRGQMLRFGVDTSADSRSFNLAFTEPAFLGRDLEFGLRAYYTTTDQQNASFGTENIGLQPSLSFPVSEYGRLSLRYRLSEDSLTNVPPTSSPILIAEAGSFITSSIGYTYSYSTRDTGLNPNAGVTLRFGQDIAGLGGDREYIRTQAAVIGETSVLREEVSLRATLEGGALTMLSGNSLRNDRFLLSTRQMRGFESNGLGPRDTLAGTSDALGGNYFVSARFETAFPLGLPEEYGLSGGLFYDVGTVWGLDNTAGAGGGTVDDDLHLRQSIGFSLFWETQIGPLRFNFSHVLDSQPYDQTRNFDFTIEARF
ncbi:MAG: outer membrane protein assembly factor BamA [Rhodobacteraceae bacterium CG17_big_fil_post_rev_8_21_14_2_50_65_11]|nr:MAG: outer membrane protein assembly factor BamA [Rhodobacteraceae bacterium CG17_big_fil_post_rev_8_21_14_2_50_65_11]